MLTYAVENQPIFSVLFVYIAYVLVMNLWKSL